jgi:hypothetical protein
MFENEIEKEEYTHEELIKNMKLMGEKQVRDLKPTK